MRLNEGDRSDEGQLPSSLIALDDYAWLQSEFSITDYPKLASIIRLRKVGLPTLPGFVVRELTPQVLRFFSAWLKDTNSERLSLRFDSPKPDDHKRLLGANPTISELSRMADLFVPPVVGMVLAENDRFRQGHSILVSFEEMGIRCEVVGPGFDAADITRGRLSPHEIFILRHKTPENYHLYPSLDLVDICEHAITSVRDYQQSRLLRLSVISSMLNRGLGRSGSVRDITHQQLNEAGRFLDQRGAYVPEGYCPVGLDSLGQLYEHVAPLDTFRDYYSKHFDLDVRGRVLSASFLKKHSLVFWDLYGPDKYGSRIKGFGI